MEQSEQQIKSQMTKLGVLPLQNTTNLTSQDLVNSYQQQLAKIQQNSTSQFTSQNPVNSSQNLVNSSGSSCQLGSTKSQQNLNNPTACSLQPTACYQQLSESGVKAKQDLEVLVATGKTEDFLNKKITFNDLDNMNENQIMKQYRIYQTRLAARLNDSLGKVVLKSYVKLAKWLLPVDNEEKLYEDLRGDYIVTNELDRWLGWLTLRMGSLTAVASTTLITFGNCANRESSAMLNHEMSTKLDSSSFHNSTKNLSNLNGET